MKKHLLSILLSTLSLTSFAQINGSTTVSAGYTYSYSVSILNATTFTWTLPIGWYGVTGQGTALVTATCNLNDGVISVEGFNPNGVSVGIETINIQFSGGGGWDVSPPSIAGCQGQPTSPVTIQANGTGGGPGCPTGFGTGTPHANIDFVLYDNLWPAGNFVCTLPGGFLMPIFNSTYYVYKVDHSAGFIPVSQAILISGACGSASVNNAIQATPYFIQPVAFIQTPLPACVGDTITVAAGNIATWQWANLFTYGVTLLSGSNPATFIVDSLSAQIDVVGLDFNGCMNGGIYQVVTDSCITTGIHQQAIAQNITLTPNPATDFILVKTNYNTPVALQVYNALGQIVFENKNVVQQINIPVKSFAKGVYTVKAGNVVKRFLKD